MRIEAASVRKAIRRISPWQRGQESGRIPDRVVLREARLQGPLQNPGPSSLDLHRPQERCKPLTKNLKTSLDSSARLREIMQLFSRIVRSQWDGRRRNRAIL
jgi:hypothetical protein